MSRRKPPIDRSASIEELERVLEATGLEALPAPDPVRRHDRGVDSITTEEQEQIKELPRLVRTAKDNRRRKYSGHLTENAILSADRRGEPCRCSAADGTPCLVHHALTGRRRWVRPR